MPSDLHMKRHTDGTIYGFIQTASTKWGWFARDVRKNATGVHADVSLSAGGMTLASDVFNVQRLEDRRRLVRASLEQAGKETSEEFEKGAYQYYLDDFCRRLWAFFCAGIAPEWLEGTQESTRPKFLLDPYVVEDEGTILFGPPEQGKSWTLMLWAVAMANTSDYWRTGKCVPLFVNLERSRKSISDRLRGINLASGLSIDCPLLTFNARGRTLADVAEPIRLAIKRDGVNVVLLDSISRAGTGDLNSNETGNRVIDLLNGFGVAWVAIGHSPRGDDSHLYGSQMFDAGADCVVQQLCERDEYGTLGVKLSVTKMNNRRRPEDQLYSYAFDEDGFSGIRKPQQAEFFQLQDKRRRTIPEQVAEVFAERQGEDLSPDEIRRATGLNRQSIWRILANSGDYTFSRRDGKHVYYRPNDN